MQYDDRGSTDTYDIPPILYTLTDASYNVVGLAADLGWFRQYRYQPYGSFSEAEMAQDYSGGNFTPYPVNLTSEKYLTNYNFKNGIFRDLYADLDFHRGRYSHLALERMLTQDPNGQGIVTSPELSFNGHNPIVTVNMAYELQFADGMNFYNYLRSNPYLGADPSGLSPILDLSVANSTSMYLRGAMIYGIGTIAVGGAGGFRSGWAKWSEGGSNKEIMAAAIGGANSTFSSFEIQARVLLGSAILATSGPAGIAFLGALGVLDSGHAHLNARERMEQATTQAELDLANFDSVFSALGIGGSLYGSIVGVRGAALTRSSMAAPPKAYAVLRQIRTKGHQFQGYKGGRRWDNKPPHPQLPRNGKFKEYDLDPIPPKGVNRNMERIIIDETTGDAWYTSDHYVTFKPM